MVSNASSFACSCIGDFLYGPKDERGSTLLFLSERSELILRISTGCLRYNPTQIQYTSKVRLQPNTGRLWSRKSDEENNADFSAK
jgi:hypothetical protein